MSLSGSHNTNLSGGYYYPQMNRGTVAVDSNTRVFSNSSSFFGGGFKTALAAIDVSKWNNFTVSVVNNTAGTDTQLAATGSLQSGSIEASPDGTNWESIDSLTIAGLAPSTLTSSQFSESSYRYLRVRVVLSGSKDALTSSLDTYVTANNG